MNKQEFLKDLENQGFRVSKRIIKVLKNEYLPKGYFVFLDEIPLFLNKDLKLCNNSFVSTSHDLQVLFDCFVTVYQVY